MKRFSQLGPDDYAKLALTSLSETQLLSNLLDLQSAFTKKRAQKLDDYAFAKQLVSAYLQFYTPTNMPKLAFLLEQLTPQQRQKLSELSFIDYGAGPGTFSAAWLDYFGANQHVHIVVDKSEVMLEQAQKFLTSVYPEQRFLFQTELTSEQMKMRNSLLFCGHVLNEMELTKAKTLFHSFEGGAVLWIEPGTPEAFSKVVELRRFLIEHSFAVLYPCLGVFKDCPAAKKQGEWCHQVLHQTQAPWLERYSQKLKLDRNNMPLIAHAYMRSQFNNNNQSMKKEVFKEGDLFSARLVRVKKETKHSFEWEGCLVQDKELVWKKLSVMKKTLTKSEIKKLGKINTGESPLFEWVKELDSMTWRVRLKKDE